LLIEMGCQYIQVDAPEVAVTVDDEGTAFYESQGAPKERMRTEGVELINTIAAVPGAKFALHMCRGNWNSMWMSEGGYERLSRDVFSRATNFDVFCLEYDDHRSGSFEPLKDVPDDKAVVLGLVSTKTNTVEPEDELVARIEEAAGFFPKEQLALSTQCGFAPVSDDKPIDESTMERKLTTIANVAHRVWG
jgi:5-methyltetrahydropteroyltriglutamate--homocysteine methyltransferase